MRNPPRTDSPYLLDLTSLPLREDGTARWEDIFSSSYPLRIEVGVGNSPFLIEVSRLEPRFCYLGFEYSGKRVRKFLRKVERAELDNIYMIQANALPALGELVRPSSVEHFFVNFPDPWPKRRHGKKRFVNEANARLVAHLLKPGGGLSLRTDDPRYAGQMLEVLDDCLGLTNLRREGHFAPEPIYGFETPYELKFKECGRSIYYLEYRKSEPP